MTRGEILDAIRREHLNFLTAIGGMDDEMLSKEQVTEEWTTQDVMGHIAQWMRVALKFIEEYKRDGVPQSLGLKDDATVNAFNAQGWEGRRELPLADVIADFHAAYRDLIAAVESLSDEQLNAQLPPPWGPGDTLERLIAVNSYEHEPEHTEQVYLWRENEQEHDDD